MTPIVTERLVLREFTLADAPFILRLLNEESFLANIGDRGVRSLDDARDYLERGPLTSQARNGYALWQVELRGANQRIGMCGLSRRDTLPGADLGYALLPEFEGHGYALEAAAASLGFATDTLALSEVFAIVSPGNARSIHLLTKLTFTFLETRALTPGDEVALYVRRA